DGFFGGDEAETLSMRGLEIRAHRPRRSMIDDQRSIGAGIAQMQAGVEGDAPGRDALTEQFGAGFIPKRGDDGRERGKGFSVERSLDGALAACAYVGKSHAVSREHAREGMKEDAAHAERVRDEAGMLA